jgi:gas vesicle protein
MAYEYDRFEREEGGGSFLMGLLAGTVLGAGLGMLFAPKAGSELRSQLGSSISDQTGRLRDVADQSYQQASDKVSQIVDRGREAYDRARSSVSNMAAAGTSGSTGSAGTTGSTGNTGSGTGSNINVNNPGGSYGA